MNVMQLENIDMIGLKTPQGSFCCFSDRLRAKILRDLTLTSTFVSMIYKIITYLSSNDHTCSFANCRECFSQEFFTSSIAIGIGRIKKSDSKISSNSHKSNSLLIGIISPPSCGECP